MDVSSGERLDAAADQEMLMMLMLTATGMEKGGKRERDGPLDKTE